MRTALILSFISCFLALTTVANASITDVDCENDGDGAINCLATWDGGNSELSIVGDQFWGPGHMNGTVTTDTDLDPTMMLWNSVGNDTTFSWTGYTINVYMDNTFTLSDVVVYTPGDWTGSVTQTATWNGTKYVGTIDYVSGTTAIDVGDTFEFSYKLSFTGYTSYAFCQEMIPTPEPATMSLLGFGMVGMIMRKRRNA